MGASEIQLYLDRARPFDSRLDSDYDVVFAAERTLVEEVLDDARRFVDRAEQYLRRAGVL